MVYVVEGQQRLQCEKVQEIREGALTRKYEDRQFAGVAILQRCVREGQVLAVCACSKEVRSEEGAHVTHSFEE